MSTDLEKCLRGNLYSPTNNKESFWESAKPWVGSFVLLPFIIYYTLNMGKFTFIDFVNLLIHEGGHGVFKIFGKFVYTLGGSLMQIIIPSMFIIYYWIKKIRFGTQVFLLWLGENLMNISVYVADARAKQLPLLGGNKVYHDWNYLLGVTGLLEYDDLLGTIVYGAGVLAFVVSFFVPLFIRTYQEVEIDLPI